ncbi:MAG: cytochrome c biogenesis protein ResB, partial [Planctomycetes bacterium]|nr:cytochrome c biogenesis protein ResB [Planctomycetota bacterium]
MVTETKPLSADLSSETEAREEFRSRQARAYPVLRSLASLKLTVVLFAMAIFIVLAGTLAQVNKDIWQVIGEYFRINFAELINGQFPWVHPSAAFVRIDFQIFFPPAFFPSKPVVPGGFFFPKGWTIGVLLGLNLVAAHLVQFRVQARGWRLWTGLGIILLGVLVTWAVIAAGADPEGFQDRPGLSWGTLWLLFKLGLVALWGGLLAGIFAVDQNRKAERGILIGSAILLGGFLLWLFLQGDAFRLGDSSMRILWQLIKATLAGTVLLVGCLFVFRRRGGMVLLHGGIGLLMLSELFVGTGAQEAQMSIQEGQTVNYATDIRSLELAIVDRSPRDYDEVVVVPEPILLRTPGQGPAVIRHADLPFDIQVVRFFRNSTIRDVRPGEKNPATAGAGLFSIVEAARPVAATDRMGGTDMSSAYVKFLDKKSGEDLGTYLVSLYLRPQTVKVGDQSYEVALRHKRVYKPYTVHLIDVRKDDYLGTDTPRNYSSDIRLVENDATREHLSPLFAGGSTRNVDRKIHIWMNNPLRYAGETFYQSGYWKDPRTGVERTTLQVVVNPSWMIPYVACMIVATGMLAHFWIVLTRFLNRRVAQPKPQADPAEERASVSRQQRRHQRKTRKGSPADSKRWQQAYWLVPTILVVLCGGWVLSKARLPHYPSDTMNLYEFGKLPLMFEGRSKPFDTFARNSLRIISDRQTFVDSEDNRQPAIRWLLDVIARPEQAEKYRVFRIRHPGVLDLLGLEPRPGSRYSVEELRKNIEEFDKQVRLAAGLAAEDRTLFQRKVLQLRQKISRYTLIVAAFRRPPLPELPDLTDAKQDQQAAAEALRRFKHAYDIIRMQNKQLAASQPPLAVPVLHDESPEDLPESLRDWLSERQPWETYAEA